MKQEKPADNFVILDYGLQTFTFLKYSLKNNKKILWLDSASVHDHALYNDTNKNIALQLY